MIYYAHTKEDGDWQLLKDHLINVAELAAGFARSGLKHCAAMAGLLHDIGKYQQSFQKRLHDGKTRVDHSTCGAQEAGIILGKRIGKVVSYIFSFVIAGHHSGLPDRGALFGELDESVLLNRLKKACEDYSAYQAELSGAIDAAGVENEIKTLFGPRPDVALYEFVTRYLYSCLVDADFLDTEKFCTGKGRPLTEADWQLCERELAAKLQSFRAVTLLQKSRASLQRQALAKINTDSPLYLLDMPTGSGKTLCSIALALFRLNKNNKKRIIYVIPYTSVIEQTAREFERLFPKLTILQHHSNFDFDASDTAASLDEAAVNDEDPREILKKSTENWDAPFIITTNVQFFESIYSNRSSRLRKLHNMADSIIVFDEIHTLPIDCFIPCLKAVEQLTQNFGSEAMFLSATMPDYPGLYAKYAGRTLPTYQLIEDKSNFGDFEKCIFADICGEDISLRLNGDKSTLLIFNTKKAAAEYYGAYSAGAKYYLSTYLTPLDRQRITDRIRSDLKKGKNITVFSTSLIEVGVDLDFECVYRELAGLDNILQAAGRCNREGKRARDDCVVYIFTTEKPARGETALKANITKGILAEYGAAKLSQPYCVRAYFDAIYAGQAWMMTGIDEYVETDKYRMYFKTVADCFKLIDCPSINVVVPCKDIDAILLKDAFDYADRRKLQKYSVSVNTRELKLLLEKGVVTEQSGVFVLSNTDYYRSETGITIDGETDYYV